MWRRGRTNGPATAYRMIAGIDEPLVSKAGTCLALRSGLFLSLFRRRKLPDKFLHWDPLAR
jgi:hypothetical protein